MKNMFQAPVDRPATLRSCRLRCPLAVSPGLLPLAFLLLPLLVTAASAAETAKEAKPAKPAATAEELDLRLTLPPVIDAVAGLETRIVYDNIILSEEAGKYRFEVKCEPELSGQSAEKRWWKAVPVPGDVGRHKLTVQVLDQAGKQLAQTSSVLNVVPADAGKGNPVRLLIVGDSLTHATIWPNELARLLSEPGNPQWTMLGTHRPSSAAEGVAHEGYGGWTWSRFVSQYEPNPDGTYRKRSSPFVYLGEDGKPALDLPRYFREECDGKKPDVVVFLLGINDCFGADPQDPDPRIDGMLEHADTLLKAFRKEAPQALLGICVTPPGNSRESAFESNYNGRYPRWGWKRIQHRLVERQLALFGTEDAAAKRLSLVPIELGVDPQDGYPDNNSVHPNATGYRRIATDVYAWLKARLAAGEIGE